jgi:hypothetical protein
VAGGAWLAKIDLKAFFRHVPLDPADWGLMAFRWDGQRFVDTRLNFGQRNAPEVAYRFAMAVLWAVQQRMSELELGIVFTLVVCDDWLVVAQCKEDCRIVWELLMSILAALGFEFARHKCVGPCQELIWLGLLFDSVRMTVSLPEDKLEKALALVQRARAARKLTRSDLDRLFGYLSYCAGVVFGGRAFLHGLRRLRYRGDSGVALAAGHRVHVSVALREDMRWWEHHLRLLNGDVATPIVAPFMCHEDLQIFLDARGGSGGIGVFFDGAFVALTGAEVNERYPAGVGAGPGGWAEVASPGVRRTLSCGTVAEPSTEANHWELMAFVVLLDLFPDALRNRHVVVMSDSQSAISCVRCLAASLDSPVLAHLTRCVLSRCVELNVRLLPLHIPGVENVLADHLSRDRLDEFASAALGGQQWVGRREDGAPLRYLPALAAGRIQPVVCK